MMIGWTVIFHEVMNLWHVEEGRQLTQRIQGVARMNKVTMAPEHPTMMVRESAVWVHVHLGVYYIRWTPAILDHVLPSAMMSAMPDPVDEAVDMVPTTVMVVSVGVMVGLVGESFPGMGVTVLGMVGMTRVTLVFGWEVAVRILSMSIS